MTSPFEDSDVNEGVEDLLGGYRESTRDAYLIDYRILCRWLAAEGIDIKRLTPRDAMKYFRHEQERDLKPATVARRQTSLKLLMDHLAKRRIVDSNPLRHESYRPVPTPPKNAARSLTITQAKRVLEVADSLDDDRSAATRLLLLHGLTGAEIRRLESRSVVRGPKDLELLVPKRTVRLSTQTSTIVRRLHARSRSDGGPLVRNQHGRRMQRSNLAAIVERAFYLADLDERPLPSTLRDTFFSLSIEMGSTLHEIAETAGIRDVRNLQRTIRQRDRLRPTPPQLLEDAMSSMVAGSVLTQSVRLVEDRGIHPAAAVALAGAALESDLRARLGEDKETITALANELVKRRLISAQEHRRIVSWADLRNAASHGRFDTFSRSDARTFVRSIAEWVHGTASDADVDRDT